MSLSSSNDRDFDYILPDLDYEINCAKAYLQQRSPDFNNSLYDHLLELLCRILADRPKDPYAIFEAYSQKVKNEIFNNETESFRNVYLPPSDYEHAKKLIEFFKSEKNKTEDSESAEAAESPETVENPEIEENIEQLQDLPKLFYNFQLVGVSLPQSEVLLLDFSIRELLKKHPIENVRFWGKIFGTLQNYFIVEANLQDQELERRLEILERTDHLRLKNIDNGEQEEPETQIKRETKESISARKSESDASKAYEADQYAKLNPRILNSMIDTISDIPVERLGTGTNANVYFVCNFPGLDEWIELPPVTPQQIIISRHIVRYFTGNLDTEINSFPPFPGNEKNYLRAQIARISATTLISPVGYFKFGENEDDREDEEEMDEDDIDIILEENEDYEPPLTKDLIDPAMSSWCHHSSYIQKQGRAILWKPEGESHDQSSSDGEEMEKELSDTDEIKTWSRLLTPLSKDVATDGIIPWSTRHFSKTRPETSVVLVRSNMWPGAFAYAAKRHFGNIYIGWGHKVTTLHYIPIEPIFKEDSIIDFRGEEEGGNIEDEDIADLFKELTQIL